MVAWSNIPFKDKFTMFKFKWHQERCNIQCNFNDPQNKIESSKIKLFFYMWNKNDDTHKNLGKNVKVVFYKNHHILQERIVIKTSLYAVCTIPNKS